MLEWFKSGTAERDLAFLLQRRLFLHASLATTAGLMGCGGGGGGSSSSSTTNPPITPTSWTQDYVADSSGRIWYVSPTGSDSAAGSAAAPFATLSHAVTVVAAGDTVVLADGTYPGPVTLERSGSPSHYITLRAAHRGQAKLVVTGNFSALNLKNVGWVRVEGLDVQADQDHGIQAENSHHIQVVGNVCHDCGGGGIALNYGDYFLVEGNTVYNNTATNTFQTSGISVYQARAYDSAAGFHIIIRGNMVYDNVESAIISATHTEGNGIILDDHHNSQGGSTAGNYTGTTLVENNLVAFNGGSGILAYESDNVTVRHNTVVFNNTDMLNPATWRSELTNSQGRNNHWYNNIAVCDSSIDSDNNALLDGVTGVFQNTGTAWFGNLRFDIDNPTREAVLVDGSNNINTASLLQTNNPLRSDPKFAGTPVGGDPDSFRLAAGSPAINSALTSYANTVDYNNSPRGSQPDIGALEA